MDSKQPGWYPDPISPDSLIRRWDGANWTADLRPRPAPLSQPPSAPQVQGIVACPDCGGKVSLQATQCVHCGRPTDSIMPPVVAPLEPSPPLPPPPPGFTTQPGLSAPQPGLSAQSAAPASTPTGVASSSSRGRRARGQQKGSGPATLTRDIRASLALVAGVVATVLSWLAYAGWGLTLLVVGAVATAAALVLASSAKKRALRVGAKKSWMIPVTRLLALASIVLLAFAVYHHVRPYG